MPVDRTLDCRGTLCPVPIIQARQALDALAPGQVLQVLATDLGSKADFPAFARHTGHELLAAREQDGTFIYYLRKAGPGRLE
ncbi:MAG: sulfurtransferase TusA family protein [Chloroflexi bacterium]|nr:sulfurtransferase TusA family protein [Chloroflexota bacterium]